MRELSIIGLMSGTSADGIDAAVLKTDGQRFTRTGLSGHFAYHANTKAAIRASMRDPASLMADDGARAALDRAIAVDHAVAVTALCESYEGDVDLIGFHGQTIYHNPHPNTAHRLGRQTVQLGDAAYLAQASNITVVHNVRQADMDHGGEGAPLAPIYHAALFGAMGIDMPAVLVNIGGVANVTCVAGAGTSTLIGFDTGPGNALIDDYMMAYHGAECDFDGALAARGTADTGLIVSWMQADFFNRRWPKSLDRQAFSALLDDTKFRQLAPTDAAATLTEFTAQSIAHAIAQLPVVPKTVYVAGGGRRNPSLMAALTAALAPPVITDASTGFAPDMVEAELMAFLAARCHYGLATSFPGTTGCRQPVVGGQITAPK